jgi:transcriptional regulator with XRE-family HTH domain
VRAAQPHISPIRWARLARQLSRADLARRVGCSADSISRFENGASPSLVTARRIATVFAVPVDVLFPPDGVERTEGEAHEHE